MEIRKGVSREEAPGAECDNYGKSDREFIEVPRHSRCVQGRSYKVVCYAARSLSEEI